MTNAEIKARMKDWYSAYIERNDNSYFELYSALHTMRAANLISDKQWKIICDYDNKLFQEANQL